MKTSTLLSRLVSAKQAKAFNPQARPLLFLELEAMAAKVSPKHLRKDFLPK